MDALFRQKFLIKKCLGSFLSRYRSSGAEYEKLLSLLPSFLATDFSVGRTKKRVLLASMGSYDAKTEGIYLKALETIGYEPWVIAQFDPYLKKIFRLFGIRQVLFYEDFWREISAAEAGAGIPEMLRQKAIDLKSPTVDAIPFGKYAVSQVLRRTRASCLEEVLQLQPALVEQALVYSRRAAIAANRILGETSPSLALVNDRGYTPDGQIFDACLQHGVPVLQRCSAHKNGYEIVKRYNALAMASLHHHSLSDESWQRIKAMPWREEHWQELLREIKDNYVSGDWFSEVGTQFHKRVYSRQELAEHLQLNSNKKTAVIFPHIFWDATFFWGEDLFRDYADWFINVLKVARDNRAVNWIIKVHPANIVKARRDNYQGEHNELRTIREILGTLPNHIRVIPPESDINTFSIFEAMDYCLTVRGTIGIESAVFGIPTLTAGTGRYDRLGFTIDSDSPEEYLSRLARIQEIPRLSPAETLLARRFAYGIFRARPLRLDVIERKHEHDEKASIAFRVLAKDADAFRKTEFCQELGRYILSGAEDYLAQDAFPMSPVSRKVSENKCEINTGSAPHDA